jgi:hypothetical protein
VQIDWTWTVRESITLALIGLALFAVLLLAYFRAKIVEWWQRRRG